MDYLEESSDYAPRVCKACGEMMEFKGVGEYVCPKCKAQEFDDYGKVRNYIENHRGANTSEVEQATGVSRYAIRRMLKEGRIEVSKDSRIFMECENCGCSILSGRYCAKCEKEMQSKEKMMRKQTHNFTGYGKKGKTEEGEKRFRWER